MSLAKNFEIFEHPLDTVEIVASLRDWTYERSETEVSILAKGKWSDYQISVTWVDDYEGINIVCGFDLKFQNIHKDKILELVTSINNQMWLGHFDVWVDEGIVLYRNTSLFNRNRVSQEDAPVRIINKKHPALNYPNKINLEDLILKYNINR